MCIDGEEGEEMDITGLPHPSSSSFTFSEDHDRVEKECPEI